MRGTTQRDYKTAGSGQSGNCDSIFSPRPVAAQSSAPQNLDAKIREALSKTIAKQSLSRVQLCEVMGVPIGMMNRWTAASKPSARFPLCFVDVFCRVTGDDTLKRITLGPKLRELLELGERVAAILDGHAQKQLLPAARLAVEVGS